MEEGVSNFTFLFIVITTGMLVLAVSIISFFIYYQKQMIVEKMQKRELEHKYQQKMMLASLEAQEAERKRLSAELHDSIGAMLSTVRVSIATEMRKTESKSMDPLKAMVDETIDSVRRISRDLMPSTLEMFGLGHALKDMTDQYAAMSGIAIKSEETGTPGSLDKSKQLIAFRIAQEFVNNSIKHAEAKEISIKLTWGSDLLMELRDDGKGFDMGKAGEERPGIGLFTMRSRAKMLDTELNFESAPGKGATATLRIPLNHG